MANDIKTWVELNKQLLVSAQLLINATAEPSNIWRGAKLAEFVDPMADDVLVGDSGMTKAQVMGINGMWGGFKYWIGTPMVVFSALFGLIEVLKARATLSGTIAGAQATIETATGARDAAQAAMDAATAAGDDEALAIAQDDFNAAVLAIAGASEARDAAQADLVENGTAVLSGADGIAAAMTQGGDAPFNVIFGVK